MINHLNYFNFVVIIKSKQGNSPMSRKPKLVFDQNISHNKQDDFFDLSHYAEDILKIYFNNKKDYFGKKLDIKQFNLKNDILTLIKTPFDDFTFDFVHKKCLPCIPKPIYFLDEGIPWPVVFLIKLLEDMKKLNLPKEFHPGLILLYFKYCKGVDIPNPRLV